MLDLNKYSLKSELHISNLGSLNEGTSKARLTWAALILSCICINLFSSPNKSNIISNGIQNYSLSQSEKRSEISQFLTSKNDRFLVAINSPTVKKAIKNLLVGGLTPYINNHKTVIHHAMIASR